MRRGRDWPTPERIMSDRALSVAETAWKAYAAKRQEKDRRYIMSGHEEAGYAEALLGTDIGRITGIFGPPRDVKIERTEMEDDDKGTDLLIMIGETPLAVDVTTARDPSVLEKKLRSTQRGPATIRAKGPRPFSVPKVILAVEPAQMASFFEAYGRMQDGELSLRDVQRHDLVSELQAQMLENLEMQVEAFARDGQRIPDGLQEAYEKVAAFVPDDIRFSHPQLAVAYEGLLRPSRYSAGA